MEDPRGTVKIALEFMIKNSVEESAVNIALKSLDAQVREFSCHVNETCLPTRIPLYIAEVCCEVSGISVLN